MSHSTSFLTIFAISSAIAFGSMGCSSSTSSPGSTTTTNPSTVPTIGSSFTMMDNTSALTYDTVVTTSAQDTVHSGATVREYIETTISTTPILESFLTDGDLALEGGSSGWGPTGGFEVLPFVSHKTVIDTFTLTEGGYFTMFDSVVSAYNGAGAACKLNGQSYATDSVTVTVYSQGTSLQYYYSFIPTLGLISTEANSGGYSNRLIAYTPK